MALAWFDRLSPAECGLFCAELYVILNEKGFIREIVKQRPSGKKDSEKLLSFRVVLFGTEEMFLGIYARRNFYYDFAYRRADHLSPAVRDSLRLTQDLLNTSALWFVQGTFSPPPGSSAGSQAERIASLTIAQSEAIAVKNLRLLGQANVPQPDATVFMDYMGLFRQVLWGRPTTKDLKFLDDDVSIVIHEHLTVLRLGLVGADEGVSVWAPYEQLNDAQAAVVRTMKDILDTYAKAEPQE